MKIGDIEVVKEIIELRHQVIRTQMILEVILNKNFNKIDLPTQDEMKNIEDIALKQLISKYPKNVSKK